MTELTKSEKISLSTTEIAKLIRKQLKAELPGNKFSVRSKYYSMGSSITVSLMKADRKMKLGFDEISESILANYRDNHRYDEDELRRLQEGSYHQLNPYIIRGEYKDRSWCNGAFLTEQGHNLLKRVVQIADYYNYDDSDMQSDYYSVNYSFSLQLGQYDKPFIDGTDTQADTVLLACVRRRQEKVAIHRQAMKVEQARKDKIAKLEDDHTAKSRRTVSQIRDIMSATAIFDGKGFEVQTPQTRMRRILDIEEVRQAAKVKGIDWSKEVFEL